MTESFSNYNEVHIKFDNLSGCIFLVVMNTRDGQRANGGTRMKMYSSINQGIADAILLTQGTSKKCKVIGNDFNGGFSGGKGVIIGNPATHKTPDMLTRYGEFVHSFGGRFITGTDLNINNEDAQWMAKKTPYIDGLNTGAIGDTGIGTAHGVLFAMQKVVQLYEQRNTLEGLRVCVQGIGSVGMRLVELLSAKGVRIIVADPKVEKLDYVREAYRATIVSPDEIYEIECDLFSPNAEGGIINERNIKRLRCRYILGAANNQLGTEENYTAVLWDQTALSNSANQKIFFMDKLLQSRRITYVPDYVVNIGGLYSSICEQTQKDFPYMLDTLHMIISRAIEHIYRQSIDHKISLLQAAEQLVL
jgi:glutamate dehydrogenase/leucine dehydrogenase